MTWNVGGSDAGGHRMRDDWTAHVAAILQQIQPHLVCLQELRDATQVAALQNHLGAGWHVISETYDDRTQAVFVRTGEVQPNRRRPAKQQLLVWRVVDRPPIVVANIHADPYAAEERNQRIGSTLARMQRRRSHWPALLMGDLNLDVDMAKRRDLFTDNAYRDVETYNVIAAVMRDTALDAGSTAEPDRRLDYIFASGFVVLGAGPLDNARIADMDHHPVIADLAFVPPEQTSPQP